MSTKIKVETMWGIAQRTVLFSDSVKSTRKVAINDFVKDEEYSWEQYKKWGYYAVKVIANWEPKD